MYNNLLFVVIFLLIKITLYCQYPTVQASKNIPIQSIIYKSNNAFILYTNGTLDTIDENGKIINSIQILAKQVLSITLNPIKQELLIVYELDKYIIATISALNGQVLNEIRVDSKPFFVNYSKTGKYILYSNANSNGLVVLDGSNLSNVSKLNNQTVVYYATTNSKENIIMYYTPTRGFIRYYNIDTQSYILNIEVEKNIENIFVLQKKNKIILGVKANEIQVIDNTNGKVYDKINVGSFKDISISKDDEISILSNKSVLTYTLDDKSYKFIKINTTELKNPVSICYVENNLYYGTNDGIVYNTKNNEPLFKDIKNKISDFIVLDNFLIFSNKEAIYKVSIEDKSMSLISNFQNNGIVKIDNDRFLAYSKKVFKIFSLKDGNEIGSVSIDNDIKFINYDNNTVLVSTSLNMYTYDINNDLKSKVYNLANVYSMMFNENNLTVLMSNQNNSKISLAKVLEDDSVSELPLFKNDDILKVFHDSQKSLTYMITLENRYNENSIYIKKILQDFSTVNIDSLIDYNRNFVDMAFDGKTDFVYWTDIVKLKKFNGYYFIYKKNRKIPVKLDLNSKNLFILYNDYSVEVLDKLTLDGIFELNFINNNIFLSQINSNQSTKFLIK